MTDQTAIKNEIARIITELHEKIGGKAARKQYQVGKAQREQLQALGIIDLMPAGYGFSDAKAVLEAATDGPREIGGKTAEGEGDSYVTSGSALWKLLNPAPEPEPQKPADGPVEIWQYTSATHVSHILTVWNGIVVDSQAVIYGGDFRYERNVYDPGALRQPIQNLTGFCRQERFASLADYCAATETDVAVTRRQFIERIA